MEMVGRDDVPRTRASLDAACLVRREVTHLGLTTPTGTDDGGGVPKCLVTKNDGL